MQDQNKMYGQYNLIQIILEVVVLIIIYAGFTISLFEYEATIPTLWKTVKGEVLENAFP